MDKNFNRANAMSVLGKIVNDFMVYQNAVNLEAFAILDDHESRIAVLEL
jgi:hypothetical protein